MIPVVLVIRVDAISKSQITNLNEGSSPSSSKKQRLHSSQRCKILEMRTLRCYRGNTRMQQRRREECLQYLSMLCQRRHDHLVCLSRLWLGRNTLVGKSSLIVLGLKLQISQESDQSSRGNIQPPSYDRVPVQFS